MMTGPIGRPWRILVVDDEENLNWSLVTSLRREQYQTDGALSAEVALQELMERPYDCVISDVKMPGMDGFELLQWLRRHHPQTRVIMMTAFGSPTARQEALQGGVVAYLEKPFDLRVLKDELRRLSMGALSGMQAGAEEYDVLDIAQVLNLTRRDIAIRVESASAQGVLRFLRGDLIAAEAGTLRGDAAFFAICAPRGARVEQEPWDGRGERNITQPLSRLIFQVLAMRERRSPLPRTPMSHPPTTHPSTPYTPNPSAISTEHAGTPPTSAPPATTTAVAPEESAQAREATMHEPAEHEPAPPESSVPGVAAFGTSAPGQPQSNEELAELTHRIAQAFPVSCSVALLRSDGVLLAQNRIGIAAFPPTAFAHLTAAAQAALRALLVADWGAFEEYHVLAAQALLVVRRQARGVLCAVALSRDADPSLVGDILSRYEAELVAALR